MYQAVLASLFVPVAALSVAGHAAPPCGSPLFPLEVQPAPTPVVQMLHDVNGDGALDLVMVSAGTPSRFNLYLNISAPGLGEPVVTEIGGSVVGGAFADLDADGDRDAVVLIVDPERDVLSFAVHEDTGEGVFVERGGGELPPFTFRSVTVADLDDDDRPDLVLAFYDDHLGVLLGTAPFSFEPAVLVPTPSRPLHIAATDLTRGGRDEVVVSSAGGALTVYRWVDGSLVVASAIDVATGLLETVDLIPGGAEELLVVGSWLRSFRWTPSGFELIHEVDIEGAWDVALLDWDGDGDTDVVTAADEQVEVHLQQGDGVFGPTETFSTGDRSRRVVGGDLDRDGQVDLLVHRSPVGIIALLRGEDGGLPLPRPLPPADSAAGFVAGDFTGDGRDDLIGFSRHPVTWHLYEQQADARFVEIDSFEVGGQYTFDARAADLDGDGDSDIVTTAQPGNLKVAINVDGGVSAITNYGIGSDIRRFDIGDLDLDGDLDIAIGLWADARIEIRLNDGAGGFSDRRSIASERLNGVAVADVDGDGLSDLVTTNASIDQVSVFRNVGNVEFTLAATYDVPTTSYFLAGIEAADLDQDGFDDVVAMNYDPGRPRMLVLLADRKGGLLPAARYDCLAGAGEVEIGDVDGDAILDLVVGNWIHGSVSVFRGAGDGSFGAPIILSGQEYLGVTLHDIDADGHLDVLVAGDRPGIYRNLSCRLGDLDRDGVVGRTDLDALLDAWGPCMGACPADLDNDGSVGFSDVLLLLHAWG